MPDPDAYVSGPIVAWIFVETDTRNPLYQRDAETGSMRPWFYDDRETAEAWLDELANVKQPACGHPINREWIDIVGIDADNFAKYKEWN